ncbi:MAG: S1/P1 nuclease [Armatimonadetes bacterium]|nr:S1/P1 nuclease [Armatimonadota bacterium]
MTRKQTTALLALALCGLTGTAPAWDSAGHEQIADVAWTKLTPHAKKEVAAILAAGDPSFRPTGSTAAAVRRAFDLAATFPDYLKTHTDTLYEPLVGPMNARWQPHLDPLTTDREAFRCRTWHYYDTPIRFTGAVPAVKASNALVALTLARQQIRALEAAGSSDRRTECWWLYWVEHLTGDLHQPLHCATSCQFSATGDAGGNLFKLGIPDPERPDRTMNLHAYWDTGIARAVQHEKAGGLSDAVSAVSRRWTSDPGLAPSTAEVRDLSVRSWIAAGARLADRSVYAGITVGGVPSEDYSRRQAMICERQSVLAGERLARWLNSALGQPSQRRGANMRGAPSSPVRR